MRVVLDAHLSPAIALWLNEFDQEVHACSLRALGKLTSTDKAIYQALRHPETVFVTKDDDFKRLSMSLGPPPHIVLLSFGNTTNEQVRQVLRKHWDKVKELVKDGSPLIEIR